MIWVPKSTDQKPVTALHCLTPYLFIKLMSSALVVRSMDLIFTRIVGVIGAFACLSGLKLRIAFTILLEMDCRVRIMTGRQFNVALTKIGSL